MTFRSDKKHKFQESKKSTKNFPKLASDLQRFLATGKIARKDLKNVDDYLLFQLLSLAEKALQSIDRLKAQIPKTNDRDALDRSFDSWRTWLSEIKLFGSLGYSSLVADSDNCQSALESLIDSDTDIFAMLIAFNESLASRLKKSSYELPDARAISKDANEIIDAFGLREKLAETLPRSSLGKYS